jgi:soluble lytic murein transglycosylase-like protein
MEFRRAGNEFDSLIRGWTQYWNDILMPSDHLDPDVVKALIASESGFDEKTWNHRRGKNAAYGLMQVTNACDPNAKNQAGMDKFDHALKLLKGKK